MKLPRKSFFAALALVAFSPLLGVASAQAEPGVPFTTETPANPVGAAAAAKALIARVLPGHASRFVCEVIPQENGRDVFEIEAVGGDIVLRGNDGVSLAMAFNTYLRDNAHANFDWFATQSLTLAGKLPAPAAKVRRVCAAKERFFLNYCTYGYTMPWWNAAQWSRFVDWMAMNGINRPLLQAGTEAVWLEVWKSYGLKEDDIRNYFGGPAHLPWHRMANHDKWGGPLPVSYIQGQRDLQKGILAQARGLGMSPILSGFAGHVPEAMKALRPGAKITRIAPGWGGMSAATATWFVDPEDPLFKEVAGKFIAKQREMYGTDHRYGTDPFNEMSPPSWEPAYLAKVAKTIYESMSAVDPDAVWYQMSWTFYFDSHHWTNERLGAMTRAVPTGKLVYLDYVCEETEHYKASERFHGAPFIWNYLANFGGNTHLFGPLEKLSTRAEAALKVPNCVGVGSTLEGLNTNPVAYDLLLAQPWLPGGKVDLAAWVDGYAATRAGRKDPNVSAAWKQLLEKVLAKGGQGIWGHGVAFQGRPNYEKPDNFGWTNPSIPYKNAELVRVLDLLFAASPESAKSDGYRFDVVNLTRQALGNHSRDIHRRIFAAIKAKDVTAFRREGARFLELARDVDALLATRHEFLLGDWISSARSWGKDAAEKDYYEHNAREIITTWHKAGGGLTDYSNRQWNGMIGTYYVPRWEEFFRRVDKSLTSGEAFDAKAYAQWVTAFEDGWAKRTGDQFPSVESGDAAATAKKFFAKYRAEMLAK